METQLLILTLKIVNLKKTSDNTQKTTWNLSHQPFYERRQKMQRHNQNENNGHYVNDENMRQHLVHLIYNQLIDLNIYIPRDKNKRLFHNNRNINDRKTKTFQKIRI